MTMVERSGCLARPLSGRYIGCVSPLSGVTSPAQMAGDLVEVPNLRFFG